MSWGIRRGIGHNENGLYYPTEKVKTGDTEDLITGSEQEANPTQKIDNTGNLIWFVITDELTSSNGVNSVEALRFETETQHNYAEDEKIEIDGIMYRIDQANKKQKRAIGGAGFNNQRIYVYTLDIRRISEEVEE